MLIGSVIGSTDAASVFSILRSRKLNFKNNIASLLEIESGSNDPTSYMLTVIVVAILEGKGAANIPLMIFSQIFFGILCGVTIAVASVFVLKRINFGSNGLHIVFVIAIALLAYSVPVLIGGNGYLSVYLAGIILGNSRILNKVELVHFFDGVTWLMQILIFFVLGLLSFPSRLPQIFLPALVVFIVLTFIARPIAVFSILSWFKTPFKQQLLVSWAGLRGAASIVFAIYAITNCHGLKNDIFHIVFCVALLSVTFQGTLLPLFAKKLKLIDLDTPVLKTFTDYQDDSDMKLVEIKIKSDSSWVNKALSELVLPDDVLIVMIKRAGKTIIPRGGTVILENDTVVVSADSFENISAGKITSAKL